MLSFEKTRSVLRPVWCIVLWISAAVSVNAQVYSSGCGIGVAIPDNSCGGVPLAHDIPVSGVTGTQMGVDIMLSSVSVIIAHTFDGDVEIYLESPGGVSVPLSIANGSLGDNYGDPLDVTCTSVTTFSRTGADGPVNLGVAPFIGSFIPAGNLDAFNDSTDPNGTWKLVVCDGFTGDTGTLEFVSLEFSQPCETPSISSISATTSSAIIGWPSTNPGADYILEYGTPGFTPGGIGSLGTVNGTSIAGNNTANIFGLSPFTVYDFYLTEDCGSLVSGVSGPYTFTTNKPNDVCAGAVAVSCGDVVVDSTSAGASSVDAPAFCGVVHNDAPGLWYVVTGNGMDITVSTCGFNGYDTRIGVFEGPCLDLTCIDGNEDFCGSQSQVTFSSGLGTSYYIYVSGNVAAGVFELTVTCAASLVINEVDYAQMGIDSAEFVEIKNTGSATVNLNGLTLLLVDGTGGGAVPYDTIDLPNVNLAAGDYFVVCGSASQVANCDFEIPAVEWLRDGSPDAVALAFAGNILDVVSYNGNTGGPYIEGSGVGLEDDSTVTNSGISRLPDGADSGQNNTDFSQRCITPGASNIAQNSSCTVLNDSCAYALVIDPALDIPFSNIGATTDGANDVLCFFGGSDQIYSDLWYSFTPLCDGIAIFSTVGGTSYDTRVAVYQDSCTGAILECNDDSSLAVVQSTVTWAVTSGTTYILRLGGFSSITQDTGTFDLILIDTVPPMITCGTDRFKITDPGTCSAVVNPAPPTASDNCGDVTVKNDFNATASAMGTYPVGTTTVTWTATDENGITATCVQTVEITDLENPVITCPQDYTQTADPGVCSAVVTVASPSVSDNCTLASVLNDFNGTPSATDTYAVGITIVIWTVTDSSGNFATCSHTITITDDENPVITCPANIVIPSCGSAATVPVPTNSDNCSVASLVNDFNFTNDASGIYPIGTTTVIWTVTDFNSNTATCSMTVTRNTPPAATITPNPAEACALTNLTLYGNSALDSAGATHSWTGPLIPPTNRDSVTFNLGIPGVYGPVIYAVTDSNGCTARDTIFVTVFPKPKANVVPDVIELCEGDTVNLAGNPSDGTPPYAFHVWTGDTMWLDSAGLQNPVFVTPVFGNYALTYTVTDSKNCSGSDNVLINVNQNPTVGITPDPAEVCQNTTLTLNANLVAGGGAILSQGWTGAVSNLSSVTAPVVSFNTSTAGNFNLTFTVTDNNLCRASDDITVVVNANPVVSFSGLQAVYCADELPDTLTGTPSGGTFSGAGVGSLEVTSAVTTPDTILSSNLNIYPQAVSVPGTALGSDVVLKSVCFKVRHPFVSDLDILLESPSGEQVLLLNAICGNSDNLDVCIETGSGNAIDLATCNVTAPALSGTFTAFTGEDLDSLNNGSNPNGNWNLLIMDNFVNDDGSILEWSLNFEYSGVSVFNPLDAGVGTHNITYLFVDSSGCTGSQAQSVTVNPSAVADAGADATICTGDSIELVASGGADYLWSTGDSTAAVLVGPLVTTTYTVTVTNSDGCTDEDTVVVVVNARPAVAFSGLDTLYCQNAAPDTLDGTPDGGIFSGPGITAQGAGDTIVNYSGDTVFIASDTVTVASETVNGVVGSALGVDVVLESVCFNLQHTFVQDIVVELTSPGGLTVVLTTQPCADNDDLDVCIEPGTGNSMDVAACSGTPPALTGTFTASSSANDDLAFINDGVTGPNGVWTLSVTDLATGDDGNIIDFSLSFRSFGVAAFDPAAAGPGTHTIYYSFTDGNGCTGIDSAKTKVLALPPALAVPDTGICPGGTVTLTATGGTGYAWSTGSTTDTTVVTPALTTVYTVSVTDSTGCTGTDDVTVTVFTNPVIDAGADTVVCSGTPTTLTATGGSTYVWSTGDSTASTTVIPVTLSTFSVTGTDVNGCSGADTVEVDVNPLPVASPGPDEDICIGGTTTITATGGDTYYWSDGIVTSGTGDRSAAPLITTVYTVEVEDSNGCRDTTFVTVSVHPHPIASISGLDSAYCNNNNPLLLSGSPAGGTFAGPGITGDTLSPGILTPGNYEVVYLFIDSFGCSDTDTAGFTIVNAPNVTFSGLVPEYCPDTVAHQLVGSPSGGTFSGPGVGSGSSTFVSFFAGTGTHDIVYTYFAAGICPGRDTQSVVVHPLPDVRILDLGTTYCSADNPDTLTGDPAGGIFSGAAMVNDVFFPPQVVTGTPSVVTYEVVDSNGCFGANTKVTTVYPNPSPVIVHPGNLCDNDAILLLAASPPGGVFAGPGVNGGALIPQVAGAGIHLLQYTYSDVNGCAGDTSISITIHDAGTASFTGLDSAYCANEPVAVLTGTPAGGLYFGTGVGANLFDPGAAGTGGPYDVVYAFTDSNNCVVTDTQTTSVINSPFAQIGGLDPVYCQFEGAVTVNLFPAGGELTGAGVSGDMFNPNAAGVGTHVLSYKVTNAEGCNEIDTFIVVVDACVGIDPADVASVSVYPNPSEGRFIVEISGNIEPQTVVQIFDLAGKMIAEERLAESVQQEYRKELDLTAFAKGVYYLRVNFREGMLVRKIVIE